MFALVEILKGNLPGLFVSWDCLFILNINFIFAVMENAFWYSIIGIIGTAVGAVIGGYYTHSGVEAGVLLQRKQQLINEIEEQLKHLSTIKFNLFYYDSSGSAVNSSFSLMDLYNFKDYLKVINGGFTHNLNGQTPIYFSEKTLDVLFNINSKLSYPIFNKVNHLLGVQPITKVNMIFRKAKSIRSQDIIFVCIEDVETSLTNVITNIHCYNYNGGIQKVETISEFITVVKSYISELNTLSKSPGLLS